MELMIVILAIPIVLVAVTAAICAVFLITMQILGAIWELFAALGNALRFRPKPIPQQPLRPMPRDSFDKFLDLFKR